MGANRPAPPHAFDRELRCAVEAAQAAGSLLVEGISCADKRARSKRHENDPVTIYDERAEQQIVRTLAAAFPDDGILSEEGTRTTSASGRRWLIDPLDGTNNFLAGIPHVAVSIALEAEGRTLVACVHDPIRGETFSANLDAEARLNGQTLRASKRDTLDGSVVGVGLSYHPQRRKKLLADLGAVMERAGVVRTLGSAALDLAYVAAGRLDAVCYLALDPWDAAAGALLIEASGGCITDLRGEPLTDPRAGLLASNGRIHDAFLHALA